MGDTKINKHKSPLPTKPQRPHSLDNNVWPLRHHNYITHLRCHSTKPTTIFFRIYRHFSVSLFFNNLMPMQNQPFIFKTKTNIITACIISHIHIRFLCIFCSHILPHTRYHIYALQQRARTHEKSLTQFLL